ncbi:chromosomal replication initiator protein DnaA [Polymorphobacter fuscus]|uniref:Chromosomal replication initiator protein DnaA n=1 Tax=Sandarakinorhabdus fusca TaxID=1439888 RepID=A0A7C9KPE4_9SPHN|nr:chromosomal replication initiator protein DnaA [Polymorphobacter fuscus]KAB7644069.1 chromosomal replication initiator protein DnaA [Polymorphobacter fuscus]MQT18444.1 chromosomal replication initiator protein DnaA [Polymorphobacter fuscus]NJC08435.1 chromosomal replication initiator protein [Polymorphobacter fuscus]
MAAPARAAGWAPALRAGDAGARDAGAQQDGLLHAWARVRAALRAESGDHHFDAWLAPLAFLGCDGDTVRLAAPSAFVADWVGGHYAEALRHHWTVQRPGTRQVTLTVQAAAAHATAPTIAATASAPDTASPPVENRYTFDSFIVGKSNELAYNAALAVAEPGPVGFNPLFLHGTTGLGKTHLMHAIGNALHQRQPDARITYMSAERFMVEFLAALRAKDTIAFKQKLRAVDLLMIDDVQFIAGKESTQEEFFHTMNEIISAGKRLVITADRSPQNLEGIQERILSRMAWGLVADINPADYELRLNILHAKLAGMTQNVTVPADVIEFLARKITANVRELEGALNRVVAYAGLVNAPVTLEFTRETLADLLRAHEKKLTIDEIQRKVAEHYHLKLSDLMSARRAREVARPRQVAMYLAKKLTPRSLPEIGRRFGGRDHTTVMHAVKRIEELRASDREIDADVVRLTRLLDA